MKFSKQYCQEVAAAKAGMNVKTARKYLRLGKLPSEVKKARYWRTHPDTFNEVWPEIEEMLCHSPGLQAKTILHWLMDCYPDQFLMTQLRSLQRRLQEWRSEHGPDKAVIFPQELKPGRQSQSDYTVMNHLHITLDRQPFPHLLFHFMLPYSRWETVSICFSESFESLAYGYDQAVWELGGTTPDHRTDNLSAATQKGGSRRIFTERWNEVMTHYGVRASRNNPGVSHENGAVEKSHDLFKKAVEQRLLLRGSRDFADQAAYEHFLREVLTLCNRGRTERLAEEIPFLNPLPERKWNAPVILPVRVSSASTVRILKGIYSVPSRLIGYQLRAYIYPAEILLHYGKRLIQHMVRLPREGGISLNYRHIIHHLLRKPGAFVNYKYREGLFPHVVFRQTYDALMRHYPIKGHKLYLQILHLSAMNGEKQVAEMLTKRLAAGDVPQVEDLKASLHQDRSPVPHVNIPQPHLGDYDQVIPAQGGSC
jgi:hypothetical protein